MVPSGSVDVLPSAVTVSPLSVVVIRATGAWLLGGGPTLMVNASVMVPEVGTNSAVSRVSVARMSSSPYVGSTLSPENSAK